MSFFSDTRLKIAFYILNKKVKKIKRNRNVYNLNNAKNIGVIYNATHQENYEIAKKFILDITNQNNNVISLGFVDSKEVLNFYKKNEHTQFFSRKNLNWYGKPNNPFIEKFISQEFDILIDLSVINDYPIQYITALSLAKFKVGKFKNKNSYYDFMIDINDKQDIKLLTEQINHYLKIINKPKN